MEKLGGSPGGDGERLDVINGSDSTGIRSLCGNSFSSSRNIRSMNKATSQIECIFVTVYAI
jgi:hypothetical protein